jgi:hypothetical protein
MTSDDVQLIVNRMLVGLKDQVRALEAVVGGYEAAMLQSGIAKDDIAKAVIARENVLGLTASQKEIVRGLIQSL